MNSYRSKSYVVGGGVIGLLAARELLQEGRQVVVMDRQSVGLESSWAGGGILSPLYPWRYPSEINRLASWSQAAYPDICRSLAVDTGIDPEWTRSGLLVFDPEEQATAQRWAVASSVFMEALGDGALRRLAPRLAAGLSTALYFPEIAQVRNPRLLRSLRRYLLQSGVEFLENTRVTGLAAEGNTLRALVTDQGELPASQCLLAAGAWTGEMLTQSGLALPVVPVRGQMLLFRGPPGLIRHILLKEHHYIIPRRDGRVLVGSTLERVGFDKSTTAEARAVLLGVAAEMVPALAACEIERHWAGLRPGSPGGIPFIGPHPQMAGLVVCSGHFRNGLVLGPASARLAVDLLLGRDPLLDPRPYRLDRPGAGDVADL